MVLLKFTQDIMLILIQRKHNIKTNVYYKFKIPLIKDISH